MQTSITLTLVLLEWIFATDGEFGDESQREVLFYSIKSASLIGKVTMTTLVKDELECAFMCFRHYPSDCLSFNFRRESIGETHVCELSNSERALEPDRMQNGPGFDYFGVQTVYLSRFYPCLSSPCRYGGTCLNGPELERFWCNCSLEISVLPYIDNKCNVNKTLIIEGSPVGRVFYAAVDKAKMNYYEAERLCEMLGAILASLDQLTAAHKAGLNQCNYGWLIDATARYPMQTVKPNCGNRTGVIGNTAKRDKHDKRYSAYCYKL